MISNLGVIYVLNFINLGYIYTEGWDLCLNLPFNISLPLILDSSNVSILIMIALKIAIEKRKDEIMKHLNKKYLTLEKTVIKNIRLN